LIASVVGLTVMPAVSLSVTLSVTFAGFATTAYSAAVLPALRVIVAAQGCVPSAIRSSAAVIVIVCGVFQLPALNVKFAGATVHSVVSVLAKSRSTVPVGRVASRMVKAVEADGSARLAAVPVVSTT